MKKFKTTKQKIINQQLEIKKKIGSIEIEAYWFRRVFHTFAASFLIYYILPDEPWINTLKTYFAIGIVFFVFILELIRIKGVVPSSSFFGLRVYEEKRPASYVYFGVATLVLLLFFPQQIAIPCILCACFSDPIIGEIRHRYGKKEAYIIGFFVCMFFFIITWHIAETWIIILISLIGSATAVIGESKKFWLIDDDFMIQMLPATILLLLWQGFLFGGINILPAKLIIPI
jgi:dolichol kinase